MIVQYLNIKIEVWGGFSLLNWRDLNVFIYVYVYVYV